MANVQLVATSISRSFCNKMPGTKEGNTSDYRQPPTKLIRSQIRSFDRWTGDRQTRDQSVISCNNNTVTDKRA